MSDTRTASDALADLIVAVEARWDEIPDNTFRCINCKDTGFIVRQDQHGRWWGKLCQPCHERYRFEHAQRNPDPFAEPFQPIGKRKVDAAAMFGDKDQ